MDRAAHRLHAVRVTAAVFSSLDKLAGTVTDAGCGRLEVERLATTISPLALPLRRCSSAYQFDHNPERELNMSQIALLAMYAAISVFLAFTAYRVLPGFAWGGRGMDQAVGSVRIRQVDDADGPAGSAATSALNVMGSMTPGGMASLMCASMFLCGVVLGGLLLPALFMATEQSNSIYKSLIAVAAIAWGVTLGSATVVVIRTTLILVVLVLILMPLGALASWIFRGDAPLEVAGIEVSDMHGLRRLEVKLKTSIRTGYMPVRYEYNLCTLVETLFRWKGSPDISQCVEMKK